MVSTNEDLDTAWIIPWLEGYVARAHPQLGRDGVVCPFMVRAIRRKYVTVGTFDGRRGTLAFQSEARECLGRMQGQAAGLGSDRIYLAHLIMPYGLAPADLRALVAETHSALKPDFIGAGYMAGDFWPDHETVGLHNDDFRPFSSPAPLLGMRPIVPADMLFFEKHESVPAVRLGYLAHFHELFAGRLNSYWYQRLVAAEEAARRDIAQSG